MKIIVNKNVSNIGTTPPAVQNIVLRVNKGVKGEQGIQGIPGGAATLYAGGTSAQMSNVSFNDANGVSWVMSTNATGQTLGASLQAGLAAGSVVVGTNTLALGQVVLSNSPTVTWGINGSTVTASAAAGGGAGGFNSIVAGTQTANSSVSFANSNGISFGLSNSSILTASHNGLTSQSGQALSGSNGSFGFQTATFGTLNGISFYTSNGSMVASHNAITSQSAQTQSVIAGIYAGTQTQSTGTLSFADSNGIVFGLSNNSVLTASHNGLTSQSGQGLSGSNGSFAFQTATFGNLNGVSFYSSNGSMVASHNALTIQSAQTQSNVQAIIAGTQSAFTGNVSLVNSNRMTFGMTNSSQITASFHPSVSSISGISLSAVGVGQGLIYNGADFVNQDIGNAGAGGGVNLFFTDTASDITDYKSIPKVPSASVEVDRTVVVNANTVLLEEYATDVSGLGGSTIDAGVWSMDVYCYASVSTAVSKLTFDFYKRTAGGTETLLFSAETADIDFATVARLTVSSVQQAFAINSTDRLVVKVSGTTTHTADVTLHFVYQGSTNCSVIRTPLVIRHADLVGLQGGQASEYFHLNSAEYASRNIKIQAISAGASSVSSGTIIFSTANNFAFGLNGQTLTGSFTQFPQTIGMSNLGNTSGTTGVVSHSQMNFMFAGGNNITLSQSLNGASATLTISGPNTVAQSAQTQSNIQAISAAGSVNATGTISFANSNGLAFGLSNNTITGSYTVPTVSAESNTFGISNLGNTSGTSGVVSANQVRVLFAGGNNVTLSQSTNGASATITISAFNQTTQTQNFAAANFSGGNSVGNTFLATTGTVAWYGGNNIVLSLDSANQKVTISAANQSVQTQNFAAANFSGGNSSGNSFLATSGTVAYYGGNNITLSMDSANQKVTISAFNESTQTQNLHALVVSNSTSGATTIGTSGSVSFGATNLTITAAANNSFLGFSVAAQSNQTMSAFAVSNTTYSTNASFNATNFSIRGEGIASVGVSNGSIVVNVPSGGGGLTNIAVTAGTTNSTISQFNFSNSNQIVFGINGSTITASNQGNTVSYWDNMYGGAGVTASGNIGTYAFTNSHRSLHVFQLDPGGCFPANITANTAYMNFSLSGSTATMSIAFTSIFHIGIYTRNASSLSLLNSVSGSFGFAAANTNNSTGYQGQRFFSIHSSQWSSQPVFRDGSRYFMAWFWSSAGGLNQTGNALGFQMFSTAQRQGTIGIDAAGTGTSQGWAPFYGIYTATTNAMPVSIGSNQLNKVNANAGFNPHVVLNNAIGTF